MMSDKNINEASTDELEARLGDVIENEEEVWELHESLIDYDTELEDRRKEKEDKMEYEEMDRIGDEREENWAVLENLRTKVQRLNEVKREIESELEAREDEEAEVATDGGVDIDEHVEPVFGSAIDGVAEDYDVGRDELARAIADDLTWVGIYDESDEYETAVVHLGDRDELDVKGDDEYMRMAIQMVHGRTANQIVGIDIAAYDDQYVSPTSLAPDSYTPVNGDSDDE